MAPLQGAYRPYNGGAFEFLKAHYNVQLSLRACMLPACRPACATRIRSGSPHDVLHRTSIVSQSMNSTTGSEYTENTYWGEPERAPPRALQRLRSLSHNISYVLPNAHARSLRGRIHPKLVSGLCSLSKSEGSIHQLDYSHPQI